MSKGAILIWVMAYGGAAVALFNPFIGLLVYIAFAIVRPEAIWGFALGTGNNFSLIVAAALLAGWIFKGLGQWNFGRATGIVASLLGFLGWMIASAVQAPDQREAWIIVQEQVKIVLPFMVGMTTIRSIRQLQYLAWVIVLGHAYVAYELNLAYYYTGENVVHEQGFGGMDNNCVAITMVTASGLAFFLGLQSPGIWKKALGFVSAGLMAHVVMLTFSRGGMIALIICGGVTFLLIPKKPMHYAIFLIALLLGFRLAGPQVVERFSTIFAGEGARDASAQSRIDMWKDCLDIMAHNPILGLGPHHFPSVAPQYGWPPGKEAHTLWLQIGAELGFPGLALLIAFYGLCVIKLWPNLFRKKDQIDPWFQDTARMVIPSIVAFAVSAQFVSLVGLEAPYYVVLLGAGALKLQSLGVNSVPVRTALPSVAYTPRLPGFY